MAQSDPLHMPGGGTARSMDTDLASAAKAVAAIVGAVFLLVGILGFIPGITTDYDLMEFAGHDSRAMLFGVFQVSVLHNIVHLAFGVVGLAAARRARSARYFLAIGGLIYLALWIYGLAVDHQSDANFVPLNNADDWLHLGLGVGMILLALLVWGDRRDVDRRLAR